MSEFFEPCGAGCACNDLTMVCWGPIGLEPESMPRITVDEANSEVRAMIAAASEAS